MHEGIALLGAPAARAARLARTPAADARALRRLLLTLPDQKTVLRGELSGVREGDLVRRHRA